MRSLFFWTAVALLLPQAVVTRRRDVSVVAQIARAPAAREGRPVRWSAVTAIVAVVGVPPLGGFPLLPQPLRSLFEMRDFRDGPDDPGAAV